MNVDVIAISVHLGEGVGAHLASTAATPGRSPVAMGRTEGVTRRMDKGP
eukprot:CAMPEP_0182859504 /NCGR_PEP_ID=MMETSP0034_2-20130328/4337_1 /TAXON_ID=156128 /ORGANISM="Nephroselmis pyriformis, Strain CCMP717" /LENGTH=48 /DNA_ID= /DNA_START= /DNA_END= /DNA_ORIENTATION=